MPHEGERELNTTPGGERDPGLGRDPTTGTTRKADPPVPQRNVDVIIQGSIAEASRLTGSESARRLVAASREAAENAAKLFQETKVGRGLKEARKKTQEVLNDPTIGKIIRTGKTTDAELNELYDRYGREKVIKAIQVARSGQKAATTAKETVAVAKEKLGNFFKR